MLKIEINKNGVPQFDELFKPIIEALKQLGGSGSNKEIITKIIEILNISEDIAGIPHNETDSRTELEYRAAWARTYLKKAGYIYNPVRSYWTLNKYMDLDNLNPQKVVEMVREKVSEMAYGLSQQEITSIEASQAFEQYVIQTLTNYLTFQNKGFKTNEKADLYIWDGLDEIQKQVYVEIKWGSALNLEYRIIEFCKNAKLWIDNEREILLFIVNEKIRFKDQLINNIKTKYNIDITIWDINELTAKIPTFPDKLEYLSNPRSAIVEDVIKDKNEETLTKENERKINELSKAYKDQKVVLFLGAGVSIDAGIPLWDELVNRLLLRMINLKLEEENKNEENERLQKKLFSQEDIKKITKLFQSQEDTPLMQMRYIKAALEEDKYYDIVHDELYREITNVNTELLDAIAKISAPRILHKGLESIVTYNFDDLLEKNLDQKGIEYNVIQKDHKMPVNNKLNIYHVHGYLPQDENMKDERAELIFSEEDYHRVYGDSYCWSNMAQVKAFQDNVCLFVGCSLTDPNLRRLLDSAMRHPDKPRHFAILKRKNWGLKDSKDLTGAIKWYQNIDDGIRNQIFKSFGISVIWVNEYDEIPKILNNLKNTEQE